MWCLARRFYTPFKFSNRSTQPAASEIQHSSAFQKKAWKFSRLLVIHFNTCLDCFRGKINTTQIESLTQLSMTLLLCPCGCTALSHVCTPSVLCLPKKSEIHRTITRARHNRNSASLAAKNSEPLWTFIFKITHSPSKCWFFICFFRVIHTFRVFVWPQQRQMKMKIKLVSTRAFTHSLQLCMNVISIFLHEPPKYHRRDSQTMMRRIALAEEKFPNFIMNFFRSLARKMSFEKSNSK